MKIIHCIITIQLILLVSIQTYAQQTWTQDLLRIKDRYTPTNTEIKYSVTYSFYASPKMKIKLDSMQGNFILTSEVMYTKFNDMEVLKTSTYNVIILNDQKKVLLSRNTTKTSNNAIDFKEYLNKDLKSKYILKSQKENRVRIYLAQDIADSVDMVYDPISYQIKKIGIYYSKDYQPAVTFPAGSYLQITFSLPLIHPISNGMSKQLKLSSYIKEKGSYFTLQPPYTQYDLINQL